ncbi:hypothetical protein LTR94_037216, partial [Friedmanniomyces endolithicus]
RLEATFGATPWEVVFVDDNSLDNTWQVVRELSRRRLQDLEARQLCSPVELLSHHGAFLTLIGRRQRSDFIPPPADSKSSPYVHNILK